MTFDVPAFYLDQYEVTVGRFRRYMDAVDAWMAEGHPIEGDGAHPKAPASGFKREWLGDLEPLIAEGVRPGWKGVTVEQGPTLTIGNPTYLFGERDDLAVNAVPFHVALAFCIWDGGRLPSALELDYVVRGGPLHTTYPWGEAPSVEEVFAVVPEVIPPTSPQLLNDPVWIYVSIPVGSHPASRGVFGHHDLMGGLEEWTRDELTPDTTNEEWVVLGQDLIDKVLFDLTDEHSHLSYGVSWENSHRGVPPLHLNRGHAAATYGWSTQGFRCARDP